MKEQSFLDLNEFDDCRTAAEVRETYKRFQKILFEKACHTIDILPAADINREIDARKIKAMKREIDRRIGQSKKSGADTPPFISE